jgi:hypothetical protein
VTSGNVGQIVRVPQRTCSAPTPVPSEGAHDRGQAASEWLHAETDIEGPYYNSHFTGRACIAEYRRAPPKIDAFVAGDFAKRQAGDAFGHKTR